MRTDKSLPFVPHSIKSPFQYFSTKAEITSQLTITKQSSTMPTNHVRFSETKKHWTPHISTKKKLSNRTDILEEKYHKLDDSNLQKYANNTSNSSKTNLSP